MFVAVRASAVLAAPTASARLLTRARARLRRGVCETLPVIAMTARPNHPAQRPNRMSETIDLPVPSPGSERALSGDAFDPLSDVLETLRLDGAVFFLWEPSWPYATHIADGRHFAPLVVRGADRVVSYHVVIDGPCWGAVDGAEPVRLESGDVLVLPRGDAYVIASERCLPSEVATDVTASVAFFRALARGELPPVVRDGGPGPGGNRLICGFLGSSSGPFDPLSEHLPPLIRLPAAAAGESPMPSLVHFATALSRERTGGERCLLQRLSELLFVEVLRRSLRELPAESGWLAGLRDPLVGRALTVLHAGLTESWTLQRLAERVSSSRSTLADRFTRLVGEPPMAYLTRWRLHVAAARLDAGDAKVYAVARDVGYESEAAFSRAFRREVGMSPSAWRRRRGS